MVCVELLGVNALEGLVDIVIRRGTIMTWFPSANKDLGWGFLRCDLARTRVVLVVKCGRTTFPSTKMDFRARVRTVGRARPRSLERNVSTVTRQLGTWATKSHGGRPCHHDVQARTSSLGPGGQWKKGLRRVVAGLSASAVSAWLCAISQGKADPRANTAKLRSERGLGRSLLQRN